MRLGISGHQNIPPEAMAHIESVLLRLLAKQMKNLVGVSSLAAGADQLCATAILEQGGSLHVIIPCQGYEASFSKKGDLDRFRLLVGKAHKVDTLDYSKPSEEAFLTAGRAVVDNSDLLIAIWDGKPAVGKGGTADVVNYARSRGTYVNVIWPPGMSR